MLHLSIFLHFYIVHCKLHTCLISCGILYSSVCSFYTAILSFSRDVEVKYKLAFSWPIEKKVWRNDIFCIVVGHFWPLQKPKTSVLIILVVSLSQSDLPSVKFPIFNYVDSEFVRKRYIKFYFHSCDKFFSLKTLVGI